MSRSALVVVIVLLVIVIIGAIFWFAMQNGTPMPVQPAAQAPSTQTTNNITVLPTPVTPTPATASVSISNFAFVPNILAINKGTVVTWTNNDTVPHTVTGDAGGPASQTIAPGQSYSYTFATTGTFAYHCTVHPAMTGTVVVN